MAAMLDMFVIPARIPAAHCCSTPRGFEFEWPFGDGSVARGAGVGWADVIFFVIAKEIVAEEIFDAFLVHVG